MWIRVFLAIPLCLVIAASSHAEEWNRFRGPNGSGVSDATAIPESWTADDYRWQVELPGVGHSSPVIAGDRIYVTCGDPTTAERRVLCFNTADGSQLWQRNYPSQTVAQHHDNGYATATPTADRNGVVVTWATAEAVTLLALTPDGADMWQRNLGPFVGPHGTGTSPIIVNDVVVLANEQEDYKVLTRLMGREDPQGAAGTSFLIAVDRLTGTTRWQVPRKSTLAPYATPCVRMLPDKKAEVIFSSTSHGVTAVDAETGQVNWELPDVFQDRCVGSPFVAGETVFATYGHGTVGDLCLAVRPGASGPEVLYEVKRGVPLVPTPLVAGQRLYLWTDAGIVSCLDADTGRVIWQERVAGEFYGSPVFAAGRLYCIAKNGDVVVISASDTFRELARMALGEPSFATPAVADGVLYLRTASHLVAVGSRVSK